MNYYNENDPNAAAWLRELITRGLIPQGDVDTRSITEVSPHDLTRYPQCHFFAGIGGWSRALQLAGWPSDRRVWTGSCPCQPFSVAGKGKGKEDPRHLWPVWFDLIRQCRPHVIFGEQVESAIAHGWLDGIRADLEGEGYACGDAALGAHSIGAPHMRQRLYWVADAAGSAGAQHEHKPGQRMQEESSYRADCGGYSGDMGNSACDHQWRSGQCREGSGRHGQTGGSSDGGVGLADTRHESARRPTRPSQTEGGRAFRESTGRSDTSGLGHTTGQRAESGDRRLHSGRRVILDGAEPGSDTEHGGLPAVGRGETSPTSGYGDPADTADFWSDSRWILCRDGKHRRIPTEPALFPLADGLPYQLARRGSIRPALLKGAGNAIVPQTAALFIRAYLTA